MTAGHVIRELVESDGKIHSQLAGVHFEAHKDSGTIKGVERAFVHGKADIAVGMMKQTEQDGVTTAYNQYLPISLYWPRHNEIVSAISFPQTRAVSPFSSKDDSPHFRPSNGFHFNPDVGPMIFPTPFESTGHIKKLHKNGRDRSMLPGPCYEAELQVYGASSGAPVFGMNGAVIGVINTGYNDFPTAFFTPVSEIFDISLNAINATTGSKLTLEWLSDNGFIEVQADDDVHPLLK